MLFSIMLSCFLDFRPVVPIVLLRRSNYATLTPVKPNYAILCSLKKKANYAERRAGILDVSPQVMIEILYSTDYQQRSWAKS